MMRKAAIVTALSLAVSAFGATSTSAWQSRSASGAGAGGEWYEVAGPGDLFSGRQEWLQHFFVMSDFCWKDTNIRSGSVCNVSDYNSHQWGMRQTIWFSGLTPNCIRLDKIMD